jgi:hypothetical protein
MKILDSQGRLFGKLSVLDVGAGLVILLVIIGIFFFPGSSGSVAQINTNTKPIEVDLIVRGLNIRDPKILFDTLDKEKKTNVIIRNQPYGEIDVKSYRQLPRNLAVPQPDGSVKALDDPRSDIYSTDMLLTLAGKAQITKTGPVLGNSKIKIGMSLELEGFNYDFNATIIDLRISK